MCVAVFFFFLHQNVSEVSIGPAHDILNTMLACAMNEVCSWYYNVMHDSHMILT